jgi:hypothetical protein
MDHRGVAGFLSDFAPGKMMFKATYQLSGAAGRVLRSGAVAIKDLTAIRKQSSSNSRQDRRAAAGVGSSTDQQQSTPELANSSRSK